MPAWNELLDRLTAIADPNAKLAWLQDEFRGALVQVGALRGGRNVLFYGSAFLQKPQAPATHLIITHEDLNGLMSVIYGMDWSKGLTLLLHTPGGVTNATESLVAYLRSKFADIEVAVPTFAMSAGTMISLAANRIIMGRQSQLGPIDPQFAFGARQMSALAMRDQFEMAKADILKDVRAAHAWAPILQNITPALLKEALDAIEYSERMVRGWLEKYMLAGTKRAKAKAKAIAAHFNSTTHKSHGRRIDRDEARGQGVNIEDLEDNQDLQDAVLTAYHLFTLLVEQTLLTKVMMSNHGRAFLKNFTQPARAP